MTEKTTKKKIVICDLDGTISDARDRVERFLFTGYRCSRCGRAVEQSKYDGGDTCYAPERSGFGTNCLGKIEKIERDWDSFYAHVAEDNPMLNIIALLGALEETHRIVFVSGRRESTRQDTLNWITKNFTASNIELYLRADYDRSESPKLKRNILKNLLSPEDVAFVFEDEVSTIEMYKEECPNATIIDVSNYLWGEGS